MQHNDEHAGHGGDHEAAHPASRSFSERFLIPLAIPIGAGIVIAAIILSVSQILLAVPEDVATPIALCIALIILLGCAYFATARSVSRGIITLGVAVPAIVLFGAGIGAGIYRQANPKTENKGGAEANAAPKRQITTDNKFSQTSYTIAAGQQATIDVENQGSNQHNMHVLGVTNPDGSDIKTDLLSPGQKASLTFTITQPGTYKFQCDVHPTEMTGTITVTAGAPPGLPGAAAGSLNEDATDDKFSAANLTGKAGQTLTLTLQNKGAADQHNWHLLDVQNADGSAIKTDILPPGKTATIQFTIEKPGTYNFQCDVHPTTMKGTLTVQ